MNQNLPVQRYDSLAPDSPAQANRDVSISNTGPREILSTLFKYKTKILVSFVLITCLSLVASVYYLKFIAKPVYEAKSLVLVRFGWETENIDLSLGRHQPNFKDTDAMAAEVQILQSRELAEKIVDEIKPEVIFPDMEKQLRMGLPVAESAVSRFQKKLSVKSASSGNILVATFKGPDPDMAARVLNELVNYYIDKRADYYRNPKAFQFLEQKTEEYKQKLSEAEAKLKGFQDQSQIISFDEQRGFLLNRQRLLAEARRENETAMAQIQEKNSELERQLPNIQKTSIVASEKMSEMENRLFNLQLQENELLSKYKEDNRLVTNIREQIQMIKNYISSHGSGSKLAPVDPAYQDLQKRMSENKAELSALKIKATGLDEQIRNVAAEIAAFEAQESKYKQLARNVADNEDKYKSYLSKLEESRIHDELDRQKMGNVSVLEPASIPDEPIKPQLPLILFVAMAFSLGIAGSIGLAFFLETMSAGMSTPAQAESRLELPVLAVVPVK